MKLKVQSNEVGDSTESLEDGSPTRGKGPVDTPYTQPPAHTTPSLYRTPGVSTVVRRARSGPAEEPEGTGRVTSKQVGRGLSRGRPPRPRRET